MTTPSERRRALDDILEQRVLVLDGAMGTMLQQRNLTAADFGGPALEGCNESLNRTRPDVVLAIHRAYLTAGSDAIETNTFNCDSISLHDYGLQNDVRELNITAAETCNDTRAIKAALVAIERLRRERGTPIPTMVSGTIETIGTMLAGQTADALRSSVLQADLLSIGLNCGTGPEFMTDHLRTISGMASTRVSCYPNAGLPQEGEYRETPETVAAHLERFIEIGRA